MRRFSQVDVFTDELTRGNPLAVVHAADGLSEDQLAAVASWTNLSETTFLLRPTEEGADYRVRIFTPSRELPFAGHPTLGSAYAWLDAGGRPRSATRIVQQCGAGLVRIRRDGARLAFAAPPLLRSGPVGAAERTELAARLGIAETDIVDAAWVDNGPGWVGVLLRDAEAVLRLRPMPMVGDDLRDIGVVGPHPAGSEVHFELRAFCAPLTEDPVTGSLNASVAQWLIRSGRAPSAYVAAQGTALGRRGRIFIEDDGEDIWVGGQVTPGVAGTISL